MNIKKMLAAALIVTLIAALAAGCSSEDKKAKSEVKRYDTITTAFLELRNSGIDAVVADSGVALAYLQNNPEAKLKTLPMTVLKKNITALPCGMKIRNCMNWLTRA